MINLENSKSIMQYFNSFKSSNLILYFRDYIHIKSNINLPIYKFKSNSRIILQNLITCFKLKVIHQNRIRAYYD